MLPSPLPFGERTRPSGQAASPLPSEEAASPLPSEEAASPLRSGGALSVMATLSLGPPDNELHCQEEFSLTLPFHKQENADFSDEDEEESPPEQIPPENELPDKQSSSGLLDSRLATESKDANVSALDSVRDVACVRPLDSSPTAVRGPLESRGKSDKSWQKQPSKRREDESQVSAQLFDLVALVLMSHCEHLDRVWLASSVKIHRPAISLRDYCARISLYLKCEPACVVMALIYLERRLHGGRVILHSGSVHRLLLTALVLAEKFGQDTLFEQRHYASIGGVRTQELCFLELEFLHELRFDLLVTSRDYLARVDELVGARSLPIHVHHPKPDLVDDHPYFKRQKCLVSV